MLSTRASESTQSFAIRNNLTALKGGSGEGNLSIILTAFSDIYSNLKKRGNVSCKPANGN